MSLLLPLVAALVPILALPHLLFYFDVTPKVAVLLIGTAIACCAFRTNATLLGEFARTGSGRRLLMLFAALAVALVISTATSSNKALSISGGNWRRFGLVTQLALLLFVLLAAAHISLGRIRLLPTLRTIAVTGLLISGYAAVQYFGFDPLMPAAAYHVGEGSWTIVRPPGTIGHANYLGTYLIFVVFLGGSLFWREKPRFWRFMGLAVAVAGSFAIVLTGARSAIVGALAGAMFLLVRVRPRARQMIAAAGVFLAALAIFYYSPWGQKLRSRTRWYREDPIGGARLLLWRDTLAMWRARPLVGWGPETYATEFPRFQSLDLARAYPDYYHESPHNIFFDELAAKGALGFVAFAVFAGLAAWACLGRDPPAEPPLAAAFVAALVSFEFNAPVLATALFFYLTGALLLSARASPAVRMAARARWGITVASVALALLFVTFATRLCVADVALARVKLLIDAGDPFAAAAAYATVMRWQPPGTTSDLFYSRSMAPLTRRQRDLLPAVKAWQESVQAGLRAAQLAEDRHNAYYNLASLYGMINNHVHAERSLRSAIEVAPNWFKPHWMLAQVLKLNGKREEARREARAALERGGFKFPEVVETLQELDPGK
jgi:O-antigen ligase